MFATQQAPTPQGTEQGQIKAIGASGLHPHSHHKGMHISLTPIQSKVLNLLSDGGQHSTVDISTTLHIADPRSEIRHLRCSGVEVSDIWVVGQYGARYKRYFIRRAL